jgi:hypothetical protein
MNHTKIIITIDDIIELYNIPLFVYQNQLDVYYIL